MQHYDAFRNMSRAYSDAFMRGETDAIARMVDFYGGAGTFAAWPQRVRDYAIETTSCEFAGLEIGLWFSPHASSHWRSVKIPTLVVWGATSHPAVTSGERFAEPVYPATPTAPRLKARLIS